jgi:hypothetical protein
MEPIRTPPNYCWWKPEESDPSQFELTAPHWSHWSHWSPDFESQEWQQAAHLSDSSESNNAWQPKEIPLDADTILVLDVEDPVQDEFPEFFYD